MNRPPYAREVFHFLTGGDLYADEKREKVPTSMLASHVVVICGYARSGKTTAVGLMEQIGYRSISSSQCIHKVTRDLGRVLGHPLNTDEKTKRIRIAVKSSELVRGVPDPVNGRPPHLRGSLAAQESSINLDMRTLMIKVAEDVLVANFGRRVFADWMNARYRTLGPGLFVVEVFNQEEYDLLDFPVDLILAIRRDDEQPDLDGRNLLTGAYPIYNNGSLLDLSCALGRTLSKRGPFLA